MRKGKRITITLETKGNGGVITASVQVATVLYGSGDNITVQGSDGNIYEINAGEQQPDGSYIVA